MPSLYQPGIPTGTVPLNVDYKNLQDNFNQLETTFGTDHKPISDNTSFNGYHTVIHLVEFSNTTTNPPNNQPVSGPTAVSGTGELFAAETNDGINTDTTFYFKTGGGRTLQMTRNFRPVAADNGYTFLPGGLMLQWGQVTSTTAGPYQTLLFTTDNRDFANNCYGVWTQPYASANIPGSQATVAIRKSTITKTSFQWAFVTNSGEYTGFFWWAIGN